MKTAPHAIPAKRPARCAVFASLLLAMACAGGASAAEYAIDSNHTQVNFTYNHNGYANLTARLTQVTGTLEFDPAKPAASRIDVTVPLASLSTGVPKLDAHMASADMFDAAQFPTATFRSTAVKVTGKDRLAVTGDLTIHGVTRPTTFDVTINSTAPHPMRKTRAVGFDARATIKRSDFGVSYALPGVADAIQLSIAMEAGEPRKAPPAGTPAAAPAAAAPATPAAAGKGG